MTVRSFKKRILVLSSIGIQSMHFHIPLCAIVDSDNLSRWASKYQMLWLQIFRKWNFENAGTSVIFLWINTSLFFVDFVLWDQNVTKFNMILCKYSSLFRNHECYALLLSSQKNFPLQNSTTEKRMFAAYLHLATIFSKTFFCINITSKTKLNRFFFCCF